MWEGNESEGKQSEDGIETRGVMNNYYLQEIKGHQGMTDLLGQAREA